MNAVVTVVVFFSVLFPSKTWYAPDQSIEIEVKASSECTLMLTDFMGRRIEPEGSADIKNQTTVKLEKMFPEIAKSNTYLLYALPRNASSIYEFEGTPLVIGVRDDARRGAPPGMMVVKVEPLRYAVVTTDKGPMTIAFYYDVAPNTSASFLDLSLGGFYNGLTFHRIIPDFVIQGGDPRGNGSGGPGFEIDAEFNDRPHKEGVLSMARSGDPNEAPGVPPRPEFADSAGSQFFVCLNYNATQQLDGRYTTFGQVIEGMDTVRAIAVVPIADPNAGRPEQPPVIQRVEVKPVTKDENPYKTLQEMVAPPASLLQPVPE